MTGGSPVGRPRWFLVVDPVEGPRPAAVRADGTSLASVPAIGSSRARGLDVLATGTPALPAAVRAVLDRGITALGS